MTHAIFASYLILACLLIASGAALQQNLTSILVASGGITRNHQLVNSTETYNLGKDGLTRWSSCSIPDIPGPARAYHAGFVLPNGPNPISGMCGGIISAVQLAHRMSEVASVIGLTNSCLTFDLQANKWTNETIPAMLRPRYGHAIAVDPGNSTGGDSLIYNLGGWVNDRKKPTSRFEVYVQNKTRWDVLCAYPERVADHGMVFDPVSKYVYVTGGTDGERFYMRTYRYNPSNDAWKRMAQLNRKRKGLALSLSPWVGDRALYAAGGIDKFAYLDSIERYDILSDNWTLLAYMHLSRPIAYFGFVPLHYNDMPGFAVVGGVTSKGSTQDGLIEFTSSVTHESVVGWQSIARLTRGRSHFSLVLLNVPINSSLAESTPDSKDTLKLGCHPVQPTPPYKPCPAPSHPHSGDHLLLWAFVFMLILTGILLYYLALCYFCAARQMIWTFSGIFDVPAQNHSQNI